jgi:hypothetical protein
MHLVSVEPPVQLLIEDILDPDVVRAIQQTVAAIFADATVDGAWTITIRASDTRGRWDVAWRGPGVRHFFSFPSSAAALRETVCGQLRDRAAIVGPSPKRRSKQP